MFGLFRRKRREPEPFPDEWLAILAKNFPLYAKLPAADQQELLGHIRTFIKKKDFEGCGGIEITDEIRVTIAAQACLLLLRRGAKCYPGLYTVLVYPHAYVATQRQRHADGTISEGPSVRLGEAWHDGAIVLAWDAVRSGARDMLDGHNVVMHEFAHELDFQTGMGNGTPVLPDRSSCAAWGRVLSAEFENLRRGRRSVLDSYGGTNPAEFFAVATESFFEKPHQMRKRHPELYEELRDFYKQDPAEEHERGLADDDV